MKLKKILAGVTAAALAVAALPQVISAADSSALHWTYTASTSDPITIGGSSSGADSGSGSGSSYSPFTVKFDVPVEFEEETLPGTVAILFEVSENGYSYSTFGTADITSGGDEYSFNCAYPVQVSETVTVEISAFLAVGNKVALLEVDPDSSDVQSFTLDNSVEVEITSSLPAGADEASYYGGFSVLGQAVVYGWNDLEELTADEGKVYLPKGYTFTFITGVTTTSGITCRNEDEYTVADSGNAITVSFDVPGASLITINLDTSELPAYEYIMVLSELGDVFAFPTSYAYINETVYSDEITVIDGYSRVRIEVYFDNGDCIQYTLPDSLSNGDTIKLDTEFTGTLSPYGSFNPGGTLYLSPRLSDSNENSDITLFITGTASITVTFTNADDPTDTHTVETTRSNGFAGLSSVTVPSGLSGSYNVEVYAEYPSQSDSGSGNTTPFPSAPSNSSSGTTTGTEAAPEETTQPAAELVDEATGVQISAPEGVLPEGAEIKVEMGGTNIGRYDNLYVLDITLVDENGVKIQPNGSVTVTIPVPVGFTGFEKYYIYYQADDGTLVDMHASYENGFVTFTTDHFSTYILSTEQLIDETAATDVAVTDDAAAELPAESDNGSDADSNVNTGAALLVLPAIAAAAGVIISKKRK